MIIKEYIKNRLIKKNTLLAALISFFLVFTVCTVPIYSGCSNIDSTQSTQTQEQQIKSRVYPNEIAENAQINQQYSDIASKLTQDNINYFLQITKIPHPSEHLDKIRQYLLDEYSKLGFSPQVDTPSESVYVDIPSSPNYINCPKVIIQAHMDMVPTVANPNSGIDLKTQGVDANFDKETGEIKSEGAKTNIGADDGVGMSLMLSMAKNYSEFEHPAMRFLYTTDEEIGLVGASKLSSDVLDADYLINYDWCRVGEVVVSSAGSFNAYYSKNFDTQAALSSETAINIDVSDLLGGHTADAALEPRLHASNLALNCLNKLTENNIDYKISYLKTGTVTNALPTGLSMQYYVDNAKVEQAKSICEEYISQSIKNATDEINAKFVVSVGNDNQNVKSNPISSTDSKSVISCLSKVPDRAIKVSDINTSIPETSCAIGILNLDNGQFKAGVKLRSSNNDDIDYYKSEFDKYAAEAQFDFKISSFYYAFPDNSDTPLTKAMLQGYKQICGFDGEMNISHGGLELSWFRNLKPSLKMISIGSDIKDEHMVSETYYTKSQAANTAAVLYAITHIENN